LNLLAKRRLAANLGIERGKVFRKMQGVKKKPRTILTETIRTALLAMAIVAVGIWTQFSKPHDPQPGPDPYIFGLSVPAVAVEPADPPDNDAAPAMPDLSPASPEATPDADNV
jgi:hypothetical protein